MVRLYLNRASAATGVTGPFVVLLGEHGADVAHAGVRARRAGPSAPGNRSGLTMEGRGANLA
jgi:hypothetical protein